MPIVKVNGININYRSVGEGENMVLIMGFGAGQRGWLMQVPFFRRHYRLVTFDNRGVGKSDKPSGPYSTKMMAEDTIGLMDKLGIQKANIVGVSMGGMIAQELAIDYPQRVVKLVLGCTYASPAGASPDTWELAHFSQLPSPRWFAAVLRLALNNPLYRWLSALLVRIGFWLMTPATKAGLEGQREACNKHNTLDRLSLIQAPTLVITGAEDKIIKPAASDLIASKIPGAVLVKIEGGSHTFYFEMRNAFNEEVLKFLQSTGRPIT